MVVSRFDSVLGTHVERLLSEFEAQYSREIIEQSVQACADRYQGARVTAFIPILVYRDARSVLSNGSKPEG